ncbi:6-bladed beta-propeller [Mucilaginibacter limnophilus]|uniref:6-bladed beta-propeller n=1 Tax=Mucilaginibacter limnophilus TaxID=1932778 RepID=A0A3S2ULR3_9SPHI|nr:6-bladed beta-propeller [Mucilaginibacter limnophilus]RVU00823.1 6-bladed beta-propeller [Mucilaginibacter limnophilus]
MERRTFIRNTAVTAASFFIMKDMLARPKGTVYGHNGMQYTMDKDWGVLNRDVNPVNDCHEMVQDSKGRILLTTNETKNNVLIYNKSGKLLESWGHDFPGAHGLTLADENGTESLFITDYAKHEVYKTTISGKTLLSISAPMEPGIYKTKEEFTPTEVAFDTTNGDFFVADGYGSQYILHYGSDGKLKNYFGGRGGGDEHFDNAHGIVIDRRKSTPTLLITDRTRNSFKRFSMDGKLLEVIKLPGACVCRPVIKGKHLYAAVLMSHDLKQVGTGFVTILDKNNKVVSNIGGTEPVYKDGVLKEMAQAEKIFIHPHDVCVDDDENLYVSQWASGKVYPYKFNRV